MIFWTFEPKRIFSRHLTILLEWFHYLGLVAEGGFAILRVMSRSKPLSVFASVDHRNYDVSGKPGI